MNEISVYNNLNDFINPYGYIYKIENKINNKRYIGQTTNRKGVRGNMTLNNIKRQYRHNPHLIRSVEKYRIDNFERYIIDSSKNKNELDEKEDFYIKKYNTLNFKFGYNMKEGGSNGKHCEEVKKKISKLKKGKKRLDISERNRRNKGEKNNNYRHDLSHLTRKYLIDQYWISEYNMKNRIININQKSSCEIAKENNCAISTVRNKLIKYNILRRIISKANKLRYIKKIDKK